MKDNYGNFRKSMEGNLSMNQEHFDTIKNKDGFIAALDQSGGSTPKAICDYWYRPCKSKRNSLCAS